MTLPGRSSRACCHQSASSRARVVDGAVGDDEPFALLGVGEVVAADAGADASERVAFELVVLAAVLAQLDGAVSFDDAGEEAACADGGELVRVADQDRLAAGPFDQLEHGGEDACLGHAGLIDDEHAARREPAPLRGLSSSRWSVVAGMPVSSWSFSAATPEGAAPSTGMPAARTPGRRRGWRWSCRRPARPTTQTTRLGLVATSRTIGSCSAERAMRSARSISSSCSAADRRGVRVAAALDERERGPLEGDESAVE